MQMDLVGAGQPVPQPPNLSPSKYSGSVISPARIRRASGHARATSENAVTSPKAFFCGAYLARETNRNSSPNPSHVRAWASVPVDDVADIDAIGDRDDAFSGG